MNVTGRKNEYLQRELFVSLYPIQALAVGLPAINSLVISLIVGKFIGTEGLAAMGFLSPVTNIVSAFVALISTGFQVLSGRALGKGDAGGVKTAFNTSVFIGAVIGLVMSLTVFLIPSQVSALLGATGSVKEMASDYLRGFFPSLFLLVAGAGFLLCLQMDNAKSLSSIAVVVQILSGTVLSLVFTQKFDLGMFGIGLAVSCGNLLMTLVCCLHFVLKSSLFVFSPKHISADYFKEIFRLGANSSLINVWLFIRMLFFNRVVFALGGNPAISAMTVASNICNAIGNTIEGGMSGSTGIIASVLVGERDVKGLRGLHKNAATFTYPIMAAAYLLIFIFAKPLALLFGAEPENIAVYVMVVRIFNMWMLANPLKVPLIWIYNALGKVKLVSVFCFVFMLAVPCAIIAAGRLCGSLELVIAIAVISDLLMYLGFVIYYMAKTHRLPKGIFKVNYIPRDFSVPKADTFVMTVKTAEDAGAGSLRLTDFCKAHGMEEKLSTYCGLCLEEVCAGTVSRFPQPGKKEYKIEIRGFFENGHLSLMFHDNLPAFDPQRVIDLYHPDDPDEGICFKIVSSLAEEMNYSFTLGMNTLTVKL